MVLRHTLPNFFSSSKRPNVAHHTDIGAINRPSKRSPFLYLLLFAVGGKSASYHTLTGFPICLLLLLLLFFFVPASFVFMSWPFIPSTPSSTALIAPSSSSSSSFPCLPPWPRDTARVSGGHYMQDPPPFLPSFLFSKHRRIDLPPPPFLPLPPPFYNLLLFHLYSREPLL